MAGKPIKLDIGTVYSKGHQGNYFFRYQVNKERKAISLKTRNLKEAIAKAQELVPLVKSPNAEIISAHVKHAQGWITKANKLELGKAWEVYAKHPDRAMPATVSEQCSYEFSFREFVQFLGNPSWGIDEITPEMVNTYAEHMRHQSIAVDTHNRKLRRLHKIFEVLKDYRTGFNPFSVSSLRRKKREEQGNAVRRRSFTREQEEQILKALDDPSYKVVNKPEMRVVYHLGMFTGQRFKDCILLHWDSVDFDKKLIRIKQYKTGKTVTIPINPKLLEVLKEAQSWQRNHFVCPNTAERYNKVDSNGKNTGNNLVNIDALRVIRWIGLEPSVEEPSRKRKVTVYGFHSLRHSFASYCAEVGIPKAVVLSIMGATSDIIDKYYTHVGEEAQRKAIDSLNFGNAAGTVTSPQAKIDKILALISKLDHKGPEIQAIEDLLR